MINSGLVLAVVAQLSTLGVVDSMPARCKLENTFFNPYENYLDSYKILKRS